MNRLPRRHRALPRLILSAAAVLAAGLPVRAQQEEPPERAPTLPLPTAPIEPAEPEAGTSNPEAQFHIMTGEMAANRGRPELAAQEFMAALKTVPDAALAARTTGLALSSGNLALTEAAARRWLEIDSTSLEAREVILRLALQRGSAAEVYEQAAAIVRGHAGGPDEGFRHAALLLAQDADKPELSLTLMQKLVDEFPGLAGAHYAMGLLALRFGQTEAAEKSAREALRLAPDTKDYALLLAGVLVKRGQLAESDKIIDRLARKHSAERDDMRMAYAKLLLESEQRERAREQLQLVLKNNPKNPDARFALGVFAYNDGELGEARKQFEALAKDPERGSDAQFQLGRIAERQRRYEDALRHYEAVSNGAQALDAAVRRAGVLAQLERTGEARAMLEQMRRQFPPLNHRLRLAEGELLAEAGKYDEALAAYNDGLRETPQDADLLYGRSLVYDRLGKLPEAEADLRAIIAKQPDDARALNALGYMLVVNTPRLEEARQLVAKALEITPDDAAVIDSMGWVQFKLGQTEEARSLLQKAYSKAKDPEIAAHLGEVLWVLGQRDEARQVWDKALEQEPGHRVLKETMQRLTQ